MSVLLSSLTLTLGVLSAVAISAGTAAVPVARPMLYALGDSTAAGVGARSGSYVDRLLVRLSTSGHEHRLENLAESGATSRDVLEQQVRRVGRGGDLVLLGVGANDLTGGLSPSVFAKRFEAIVAALRARTSAAVVISNVPDVSLAAAVPQAWRSQLVSQVDAYNDVVAKVARRYGAVVFDLCALTRRELPAHPEYLSLDGYHPSDRGYEAWAAGLWLVVRPLVER